jgi:hypothetical protein
MNIPTLQSITSHFKRGASNHAAHSVREGTEVFWVWLVVGTFTATIMAVALSLSLWWVQPDTASVPDPNVIDPVLGLPEGEYDPARAEKILKDFEGRK